MLHVFHVALSVHHLGVGGGADESLDHAATELADTAKIIAIKDALATVELRGVRRSASLMLLPEAKVGDYVLGVDRTL